jgi:uncharacterized protein YgbK (DUF1537 family)
MKPLIIADDFSGACDAAARAALHGYSAAALLDLPIDCPEADLLAFSTESRHLAGDAARSRIRSVAPFLPGRVLYKKIDSTLRGPWIEEVDELLAITGFSQALVCPAFPALGRTVRNGWLWIDGQPITPITCPFAVRDACTDADLARLAAEICGSILPVGSAGLAFHFFATDSPRPSAPQALPIPSAALPWLILVGSDHPASQAQLRFVETSALDSIVVNPAVYPPAVAGVFAAGGETAARFLRASEARGITALRELLPGIPAGLIAGGRYNGTVMITKAGGFGAPDAVYQAIRLAGRG